MTEREMHLMTLRRMVPVLEQAAAEMGEHTLAKMLGDAYREIERLRENEIMRTCVARSA